MADMRTRIVISLLPLAIVCFGVRYAIGRERLRSPEYMRVLYQQTYKENEERFVIVLDPKWNTSDDEALGTMRHESCHVATWGQEPDEHGSRFQECMKRFPKE